jgi:hypothetical protein
VRQFVANRSYPQRLGVLGATLVVATAPFGGLKSAADQDVVPLEVDQRIDIGPFYVTVESVKQVAELPPVIDADPTSRFLVIKAKLTNHTDRPESNHLVTLAFTGEHTGAMAFDGEDVPGLHVYDVDDAGEVPDGEQVNPDQTYTYAFVLRQSPDTDLDALTLAVTGYHFQEVDASTLDPDEWVADDHPLAEGHVPIEVAS